MEFIFFAMWDPIWDPQSKLGRTQICVTLTSTVPPMDASGSAQPAAAKARHVSLRACGWGGFSRTSGGRTRLRHSSREPPNAVGTSPKLQKHTLPMRLKLAIGAGAQPLRVPTSIERQIAGN